MGITCIQNLRHDTRLSYKWHNRATSPSQPSKGLWMWFWLFSLKQWLSSTPNHHHHHRLPSPMPPALSLGFSLRFLSPFPSAPPHGLRWFIYRYSPLPRLPSRGHLQHLETFLVVTTQGVYLWEPSRRERPGVLPAILEGHGTASPTITQPKISVVPRLRNPAVKQGRLLAFRAMIPASEALGTPAKQI